MPEAKDLLREARLMSFATTIPIQFNVRDGDSGRQRARAQAAEALAYAIFESGLFAEQVNTKVFGERTYAFNIAVMHPRTLLQLKMELEKDDAQPNGTQVRGDNEAPADRRLGLGEDGESGESG